MNSLLSFSQLHLKENGPGEYFIKDPIHKIIDFSNQKYWLYELVNTFEFQRLYKIKQLSLNWLNFPSSSHTRLVHSLGVYELCNRFISNFISRGDLSLEKDWKEINIALAYALLHDIGHGPFSHSLEKMIPDFNHEQMGLRLVKSQETKINAVLKKKALKDGLEESFYINEIEKIFNKKSEYKWIIDLVTSEVDIDRLDYLLRDSYHSGVAYGNSIDIDLFIKWSVVKEDENGNKKFSFLIKAKNHIEQFLSARQKMHSDLYLNDVIQTYEDLLKRIFIHVRNNLDEYKNNPEFFELSFFFENVETWDIRRFLKFNDENFMFFLEKFLNSGKDELKELGSCLFGFENNMGMKEYSNKYFFEKKKVKKYENVSMNLWDPETKSFVNTKIID